MEVLAGEKAFKQTGEWLPEATLEGLEPLYERFFAGLHDEVELLPGAREFIDFCRRSGRRIFLLSTIKPSHFDAQAGRLGVRDELVRGARARSHARRPQVGIQVPVAVNVGNPDAGLGPAGPW